MLPTARAIKFMGLALCAFSINGCATPSQAYWDAKVKELCEKDGGVTVFERVELTKYEYEHLNIQFEKFGKTDNLYYRESLEKIVINENPRVWKGGQKIIRRTDGKVLGTQISYGRRGGDIPTGISEESHFGCEDIKSINLDIDKSIFSIKGE